ncbi:CLUMA_CG008759, isoform A [Clunio marinus]|uniref:CLUMA_CG008759, isoform A n=1 Tax=Clunio marinus TaxID=568069 RepID=A0A1J1I6P2_9DIPT|nr:CLUMA_CG008759, isoform A [Clunio marinus]
MIKKTTSNNEINSIMTEKKVWDDHNLSDLDKINWITTTMIMKRRSPSCDYMQIIFESSLHVSCNYIYSKIVALFTAWADHFVRVAYCRGGAQPLKHLGNLLPSRKKRTQQQHTSPESREFEFLWQPHTHPFKYIFTLDSDLSVVQLLFFPIDMYEHKKHKDGTEKKTNPTVQ